MSHRDSCPDRWEARREGERAQERGYGEDRNPYGGYGEDRCEEAEREWRSGWYAAERREEEQREQEAAEARRSRDRAEAEAYERACYEEACIRAEEARYYESQQQEEPPPDDAVDPQDGKTHV